MPTRWSVLADFVGASSPVGSLPDLESRGLVQLQIYVARVKLFGNSLQALESLAHNLLSGWADDLVLQPALVENK